MTKLMKVLVFLIFTIKTITAYKNHCPEVGQLALLSHRCTDRKPFHCIFNEQQNKYVTKCRLWDWVQAGFFPVLRGHFIDYADCPQDRYQPFVYRSSDNYKCTYQKSLCSEKGQVESYKSSSSKSDQTCMCDISQDYHFITTPENEQACAPSVEDCSCYMPLHSGEQYETESTPYNKADIHERSTSIYINTTVNQEAKTVSHVSTYNKGYTLGKRGVLILLKIVCCVLLVFCLVFIIVAFSCVIHAIYKSEDKMESSSAHQRQEKEVLANSTKYTTKTGLELQDNSYLVEKSGRYADVLKPNLPPSTENESSSAHQRQEKEVLANSTKYTTKIGLELQENSYLVEKSGRSADVLKPNSPPSKENVKSNSVKDSGTCRSADILKPNLPPSKENGFREEEKIETVLEFKQRSIKDIQNADIVILATTTTDNLRKFKQHLEEFATEMKFSLSVRFFKDIFLTTTEKQNLLLEDIIPSKGYLFIFHDNFFVLTEVHSELGFSFETMKTIGDAIQHPHKYRNVRVIRNLSKAKLESYVGDRSKFLNYDESQTNTGDRPEYDGSLIQILEEIKSKK